MVRVKDLKDQIGTSGVRPVLYCVVCGSEYSANRGDYFSCSPDHVLTCCEQPLQLAVKHTVYKPA